MAAVFFFTVFYGRNFGDAVFERPVGLGHVVCFAFAAGEAFETREAVCDAEGFGECDRVIRPALGEFADAAGNADGAGRWFALPCDEAQEGRLARAIAADEADAFGADGEREIFEQDAAFGR